MRTGPYATLILLVAVTAACGGGSREPARSGYADIESLVIDAGFVSVEIGAGGGRELTVDLSRVPASIRVDVQQRGGELAIRVPEQWRPFWAGGGRIVVTAPARPGAGPRINARVSSGSLAVAGCSGPLDAVSSSGDIDIRDCRGDLRLGASSGAISVSRSTGSVRASTSSGALTLTGVECDLALQTSSGSIRLVETTGRVSAGTSSGGISARGLRLRDEGSFATSSGAIDVDLGNAASELRFELSGSSGSLEAVGARGTRALAVGGGPVLVRGRSSSGSQRFVAR